VGVGVSCGGKSCQDRLLPAGHSKATSYACHTFPKSNAHMFCALNTKTFDVIDNSQIPTVVGVTLECDCKATGQELDPLLFK
jgi:hypothetical protein